jgi:uncharacterized protein YbjT (DUF2867 family)
MHRKPVMPKLNHTEEFIMSKHILITGATGTIGQQLVKALLAAGTPFEIMSSKPDAKAAVPVRTASFESVDQLTQAFKGIDTLFVLLPLMPNKLQLAHNVAQAAKAAGVKHIVRSSGAGADPSAGFSLPRLQGEIDTVFTQSGIPSTFLRNAGFMQNYITFHQAMVKSGMVYTATADAAQSLIDVRDIAAVAAHILQNPAPHAGKAYTLTGGESLTDTQRAALLSQALAHPVGYTAVSVEHSSGVMRNEWHMPAVLVDWMDSLNTLVGMGYAAGISPDVQNLLGRAPISFAQFAKDHATAWQ